MNVSNVTEQDNSFTDKNELFEDISDLYDTTLLRYVIFTAIRSLQAIVGILGNILTLILIGTLKSKINVHILMIYLGVADLLVSSQFPLAMCIFAHEMKVHVMSNWVGLCVIKICLEMVVTAGCMLSYTILAVDR